MVVLAVHVGRDGSPHRDVAGPRSDGDEPPDGHGVVDELPDTHPRADVDNPVRADGADAPEPHQVEHPAPGVLGRVTVAAAEPARQQTSPVPAGRGVIACCTHRGRDVVDGAGPVDVGC